MLANSTIVGHDIDQEAFAQENHFCEDGHASARCADWILARLGRKEKTP